ncbi:hypothetical protein [Curtobacterium sp. L1-20]|uniref:hypothetical protein n=1 Tax=Curtobacterium sp. L1-20 TaxID=3138181 RepID=UPI003B51B556
MQHDHRRIASTTHWWVDRAADLSAPQLRGDRREQWHADAAAASEVGVPRGGLVLGMLLTAAFHRSARPRSGGSMIPSRPANARPGRVLLAAAVLSVVVASVLDRTVFFVVSSTAQYRVGEVVDVALGFVVPLVLVLVALSRVAPTRARWAAAAAPAVAGSCALAVGLVLGGAVWLVAASVGFAGLLAAWFIANRVRPRTWLLVAAPAVVLVAVEVVALVARAVFDASTATRPAFWEAEGLVGLAAPLAVAVVVAMLLPRAASVRREPHPAAA